MGDGAGVVGVDEVDDLTAVAPAPAGPRSRGPRGPRRGGGRWRGRRGVAVAAVLLLLTAGLWQQHRARAAASAVTAAGPTTTAATAGLLSSARQRADLVTSAAAAVTVALATGASVPAWGPVDLGARGADADGPLDLQATGSWAPTADGVQRVGYRLVTGLAATAGSTPCQVPTVRIAAWQYAQGSDEALPCRVMAAGVRGTAHREGASGTGSQRVQVREVVLVSGGRAASVAAWSTGESEPSAALPALGAAAAALLASAPPTSPPSSTRAPLPAADGLP